MNLRDLHLKNGAHLAGDGIPLHYGNAFVEYHAALNSAILLDRSHEGRIRLTGQDRFELLNRMSTNKTTDMQPGEGRATIFLNANGRVIDRIEAYNRPDHLLIITEPGQGAPMRDFLQRNIFFNDDVQLEDLTLQTAQFALHGANADAILRALGAKVEAVASAHSAEMTIAEAPVVIARRKTVVDAHWAIVVPVAQAAAVYEAIQRRGAGHNLVLAGSLTYNTLRIRAGLPARGELYANYIPLELGLWDEVHFAKGCYTGQEIIARMESRAKLAKTIVALKMTQFVEAPAPVLDAGREVGKMTSSVKAPTGDIFTIAILKTQATRIGTALTVGEANVPATVDRLLGEQPDYLEHVQS